MHRSSRWLRIGLVALALTVWCLPSLVESAASLGEATPAAATPAPPPSYIYRAGQPVILISSGPATAMLHVDGLPTDRYGVVTVATDSDAAFRLIIAPPRGETRTIFEADAPDALTTALLLDQTGDYVLTIEATGSWAVIIR